MEVDIHCENDSKSLYVRLTHNRVKYDTINTIATRDNIGFRFLDDIMIIII